MRLIDADELHKELEKKGRPIGYNEYKLFYDLIDQAPTLAQWYYPSKGEYPPKNKHLEEDANVLCLFNNGSRDVAWYIKTKDREGWLTSCGLEPVQSVKCWQYIIPPKEEA